MDIRIELSTVKYVHESYSVLYSQPFTIHSEKLIDRPGKPGVLNEMLCFLKRLVIFQHD